jgi:hypothetical protein
MKRPVFRANQCRKQRIFTKNWRTRVFMHLCNSSCLGEMHKQVHNERWSHEPSHNPVLFDACSIKKWSFHYKKQYFI